MAKRKTPKARTALFGKFDQLTDEQFLELREATGDYFSSNFVEEDDNSGENNADNRKKENSGGNSDEGWISQIFGS